MQERSEGAHGYQADRSAFCSRLRLRPIGLGLFEAASAEFCPQDCTDTYIAILARVNELGPPGSAKRHRTRHWHVLAADAAGPPNTE